ncbi:MAG: transcriptional repressor [Oscillospiraceae bacterium]|nr:MAG: transcriptional repressor [Oscillospiraceae bacterium]
MTRYEKKILEIITKSDGHMTADQIFEMLRRCCPSVALATVYNNLNKLCRAGLIRRISMQGMPDRFDRTARHDHLVCQKCGKLLDLHLPDLTARLQQQIDVPLLAYDLKLLYICSDCQKEKQIYPERK